MSINLDVDANLSKPTEKIVDTVTSLTNDLTKEPVQETSNFLSNLVGIGTDFIKYGRNALNKRYEYNLKKLEDKLIDKYKNNPTENICEPDFQTISTAFENAKYCDAESLREMFANLILNSTNPENKDDIHPAFSEIIKQMNPIDARILKLFINRPSLPISEYRIRNEDGSYDILMTNVFLCKKINNIDLISQSASITNLQRLGLLEVTYQSKFSNHNQYKEAIELLQSLFLNNNNIKSNEERQLKKGIVYKTTFGEKFIKVCIN